MEIEKILEILAKNNQEIQENNIKLQKLQEETEMQMKQTNRQIKETEMQMKQTDRQMKETDRQMKETDRKLDRVAKLHGDVVNSIGEVAEEYFFQRLNRYRYLGKIHFEDVSQNVKKERNDIYEYDIVMYNNDAVGVIEVKNKLRKGDVQEFMEGQLAHYKEEFPAYSDKKLFGAIAGMKIYKDALNFAEKNGLFVLTQSNNRLKNINSKNFVPIAR